MKALFFSTVALFAAGIGWAFSMPEATPANGWLIALAAAMGAWLRAAHLLTVEVR